MEGKNSCVHLNLWRKRQPIYTRVRGSLAGMLAEHEPPLCLKSNTSPEEKETNKAPGYCFERHPSSRTAGRRRTRTASSSRENRSTKSSRQTQTETMESRRSAYVTIQHTPYCFDPKVITRTIRRRAVFELDSRFG